MKEETKKAIREAFRQLANVSTMAMAMVFSTFLGVWFGYWLDKDVFHGRTRPWLTIIFFFFGLAGGIENLFVLGRRFKRSEDERQRRKKSGRKI